MIPKIIHYVWLGKKEKPLTVLQCIKSWEKKFPDYEIIEWNEENFSIESNEYSLQAYKEKKFAFASDYIRLKALYKYGGIYLDTDMEVLKRLDPLLNNDLFIGEEDNGTLAAGIIGSKKENNLVKQIIYYYENNSFLDQNGKPKLITINSILEKYIDNESPDIMIYPKEYFYPKSGITGKTEITEKTYTIHHYDGSWVPLRNKINVNLMKILSRTIGISNANKLQKIKNKFKRK